MSYDSLDSRKFALDQLAKAAKHVEEVDRPVLAMSMFGHPVWVVPAGTQMDALLQVSAETNQRLRNLAKLALALGDRQGRPMGQPKRHSSAEKEQ